MIFLEHFFEQSASRTPDAVAVDDDGATMSYGALEAYANRIAHYLIAAGVEPNDRVCILMEKNAGAYAAVLGILKSGACWVPLGSGQPEERLRQLVEKIDPKTIITDASTIGEAITIRDALGPKIPLLVLGSEDSNAGESIGSESNLATHLTKKPDVTSRSPDDLAYIIFTSGSTGMPKGVMVLHRNIVQFLDICHGVFGIEEGSRFAHHSDLTFDPSLFDLFYGWSRAGTIVPFNKPSFRINPLRFLQNSRANVWFSVPSAIASLVESGGLSDPALNSLKHLILGGEMLTGNLVRSWYDAVPDSTIYNVYGTTETAIISHCYRVPKDIDPNSPVPVGKVLPGFRVRLMDGNRLAPPGGVGECFDYGSQLSAGYWSNEAETKARFVEDPLHSRLPQVWYRTGDLLRLRSDGVYEFVGRSDTQVKIRGHRIELEEVEFALENHPLVAEAAVVPSGPKGKPNEAWLVAFVAGREGVTDDLLRRHLEDRLPRYMVPIDFIIEPLMLPRNANGKIDRPLLAERVSEENPQL
ncbi:MAG: hypothetical protein CMM26_01365 [Rhodospirillaceae bacterium]|nr:hypothetical protein [Rhodospirillaceae bacterium]